MKQSILFILFLLASLWQGTMVGQGLLFNDEVYNRQPRQPPNDYGSKSDVEKALNVYKIDLKPFCPIPQSQGFIASCTGWACGYGAMTIMHAVQNQWEGLKDSITRNAFSSLFIYNQIKKGSCDFGAYISDAAQLLVEKGNLFSKDFDRLKNDCQRQPGMEELEKASRSRIKDFTTLFASDAPADIKIWETKQCLSQRVPVIIGMELHKNFQDLPKGEEFWHPQIGDTSAIGGHAAVVIGFDDGKEAFEILNSWGQNWANNGFVWIKYKDYARYCKYGYKLVPMDSFSSDRGYSITIQIRRPSYTEKGDLTFSQEPLLFKKGYYELANGPVNPKGGLLQPLIGKNVENTYLYIFSLDANKKIHVHWPRDRRFDSRFDGKNESAILSRADLNLAIPGNYAALKFDNSGTEYICFINSREPIVQFNKYVTSLATLPPGDFLKNLYVAFGAVLEPQRLIAYGKDKMRCESSLGKGTAMPIVLKVKVEGSH